MDSICRYFREDKYYLLILLFLASVYYSFFVFSVIPPQTGWFQYHAFCLLKGDLLYKDIYVYLPPYFSWLTTGLYIFFQNNFLYYNIFGFIFIRCLSWILLYNILNRISTPLISFVSVFFGICVTSTYNMDQVYDYNPAIFTLIILLLYFFIKLGENKVSNKYIIFVGMLSGCLFMIKQTVGLVMPLVCIVLLYCIYKNNNFCRKLCIFAIGMLITSLPGILYLLHTDSFYAMIECLIIASGAKGIGSTSILWLVYRFFIRIKVLTFVCMLMLLFILRKDLKNKYLANMLYALTGIIAGLIAEKYLVPGLKYIPYIGIYNILVVLSLVVICLKVCIYKCLTRKMVTLITFFFCALMIVTSYTSDEVAVYIWQNMSWHILIHDILYLSLYLNIIIFGYHSYKYLKYRKNEELIYFLNFVILGSTLFVFGLSAAELESHMGMLIVPFALSILLSYSDFSVCSKEFFYIKNALIIFCCTIIVLLCLITKMYMPYEWHSWKASSVLQSNVVQTITDIPGLNGFRLGVTDYNAYKLIYESIKNNSNSEDKLYQFPNIPLFNVLLERKGYYVPVPYFDVCPDVMAEYSVKEMESNPPKLFLWSDLSDGRWRVHEDIFRGGNLSGQRKIKRFYKDVVLSKYQCLTVVDNNEGEQIELWKKR